MHRKLTSILLIATFFGCSTDEEPIDCEKSEFTINLAGVTDATNCSTHNGSIQISINGGQAPYNYLINNQQLRDMSALSNLAAGSYFVQVLDANNCVASLDNVTVAAADFAFDTVIVPSTLCRAGNGAVTINIVSVNPPYNYKLGNGNYSLDNTFTGLATGNHTISVQDSNNCVVTLTVTIPQGPTSVSWATDIKPIMERNCAISGCHNGVSRSNNFNDYASAKSQAKDIKSKTQDRSMPFDGSLTRNEIDLIACWVDDGALRN